MSDHGCNKHRSVYSKYKLQTVIHTGKAGERGSKRVREWEGEIESLEIEEMETLLRSKQLQDGNLALERPSQQFRANRVKILVQTSQTTLLRGQSYKKSLEAQQYN